MVFSLRPVTYRVLVAIAIAACATRLLLAQDAPASAPPLADQSGAQSWKGVIQLPGMALAFSVALGPDGGTISIPMQGVKDLRLHSGHTDGKTLDFTLAIPNAPEAAWAKFNVTVAEDGRTAEGTLNQAGQAFPVSMTRLAEGESADIGFRRPQTPAPPFPYATRDVSYRNEVAGITLAGTLSIPEGPGPHPALVFISGSGAQDRDEAILEHRPFAVIADHLARHGVASLRSDDRGVGGSGGNTMLASQSDFADDALAAVEFLKNLPEIDPAKIGLLGHSEGGGIAPIAASRSESVRFLVLLAGIALPGRDVMRLQSVAILRAEGTIDDAAAQELDRLHAEMSSTLLSDAGFEERRAAIRALAEAQFRAGAGPAPSPQQMDQLVAQQIGLMSTPWMRSFLTHDPREFLRQVRVPVLALNGSLDTQVTPRDNLPAIEAALKESGNPDFTVRELPGLNHLFQTSTTGALSEYSSIEETISPVALDAVTAWLEKRLFPDR